MKDPNPTKNMGSYFSPYDFDYVTGQLHIESGGNAGKAEKIFNENSYYKEKAVKITRQTILRWWKIKKLKTNSRGGYRWGNRKDTAKNEKRLEDIIIK